MRIGVTLPNQVRNVRPTMIPRWATAAEGAGFALLGSVGRMAYPGVMDTVALAAAAGATSRIGLISNVLLGTAWPPVLLAKEVAGIDAVSGGRLTLGLGIGGRPDDFLVDGLGPRGLGRRLDADLEVYRSVWRGDPVGGGTNPAVPVGTREVPLMFGGFAPNALRRMARWGEGYIGGGAADPAALVPIFDQARTVWRDQGREGQPRLGAVAFFAFGDVESGRANVHDYYSAHGPKMAAAMAGGVRVGADAVRETLAGFADIGLDDLIFIPTSDNLDELARLADVVL